MLAAHRLKSPLKASSWLDQVARHRTAAVLIALALLPLVMPYHSLAVNILTFGLFACGFNLLFGYTGMLSFGHAAFFGAGAYGCGIAIAHYGLPWWLAIPLGLGLGALLALLIGALAIRSRGIYFAMVTLALAQCVYFIFLQASDLTGGDNGLRGVNVDAVVLGGLRFSLIDPIAKYYFVLVFVALAVALLSRILRSPFGAAIEAVRENEHRAAACGFDVSTIKYLAFVLSALFSALAGALHAIHLSTVALEALSYHISGQVLMVTLLGGMGTFFGPFVGALAFLAIEHIATNTIQYWQFVVGIVFIALVLFFPRGIWGTLLGWMRR
ncbi:MAG TPA: branched-chain amino acid ABC transporter permease [Burkholderiales bacterium]|nr:branched-chain amino acid ABC transporter permease [Burkholderiales bacterium]